ncbi:hypothetical protein EUW78_19950 [Salmonella enterica subsp. enterica serovar Richmond]|nr:hypothetical protein [Salmonella enterica]EBR9918833.1 hypothetical protein [Salmonella enterica subsp. enterica serovar Richmond]ECE7678355.1 hypothetical protein [Salmonella enterica subsp. enterica serovar Richmond]
MQCFLDGAEVRYKEHNVGSVNIETVDGFYKGSTNGNIGSVGVIRCTAAKPGTHGRNIRIESIKNQVNICLKGTSRVTGPGGGVRTATWNSIVDAIHTVFATRRDAGRFIHSGTDYTLTACESNKKITPGSYKLDVMAFTWQRVGGVKGKIHYKLQVNVKDTETKASCNISNKNSATMEYGKLSADTGVHQKYYDAQISCNRPTSFSYKLYNATPQVNSLPLEISNDVYLGVGLDVVNGTLWVSTVNNTPLKLSGRLNSADTAYLRINSKVNTAPGNIAGTGGKMNGSAILEILAD